MSAVEALLSQDDYNPRRTAILAFGFDHECSGNLGAAEIAKYLEKQYGQNGIAVILDEGGAGLQQIEDVLYALPAFNLTGHGGDSFAPPPHTAIGIVSEIVTTLEQSQFDPKVERNGPVHQGLTCFARYSPNAFPELTRSIIRGRSQRSCSFPGKATSQSADLVTGGKRIDALPEHVSLGVSHGLAPQDTVGSIEHGVVQLVQNIVNKYNLRFEPFEDDDDYDDYLTSEGLARKARQQGSSSGTLNVEAMRKYFPAAPAPTSGRVWDIFAGTGSLHLCKNIYRWNPGTRKSIAHVHDTNERIPMGVQLNMAKFYYDFIRNFDQADI
ncbi:Carboxypeptidase S [Fusarium culmorum]|uniref:Carboxypeptidase S n=1 Tax=Fusarium culmorum TaxID=5516 RepID=A0A2T4GU89_FUSCU|nr:Carboxypeptidase S [Fusarium culmorum]